MGMTSPPPDPARSLCPWQQILDWAEEHYRTRSFAKDEKIPTRAGLVYLVHRGAVRLTGSARISQTPLDPSSSEEQLLGFVAAGQPFELVARSHFELHSYAHIDRTLVVWMYWHDLENWSHWRDRILEAFRLQHQRRLLWLAILGQRRTIDRLLGFLTLLVEEFGQPCTLPPNSKTPSEFGCCLPWSLTHAQISSAIGSTRVTVTRLMGQLRSQGSIDIGEDNLIGLPLNENGSISPSGKPGRLPQQYNRIRDDLVNPPK